MEKAKLSDFLKRLKRSRSKKAWYLIPRALYPTSANINDLCTFFEHIADLQYCKPGEASSRQLSLHEEPGPVLRRWSQDEWLGVYNWMVSERLISREYD